MRLVLFLAAVAAVFAADLDVRVVNRPDAPASPSALYRFNRNPLAPNPMAKLPVGSVRARGWLANELKLETTGMTGRLTELSRFLKPGNGWFGTANEGWEEQPYWFRGFYDLAVLTGDPKLAAEAHKWIEAVVASQDADGYFGARANKSVAGKNGQRLCDVWPHMVMLDALISHYEHTGDKRVIPLMTRFFGFLRDSRRAVLSSSPCSKASATGSPPSSAAARATCCPTSTGSTTTPAMNGCSGSPPASTSTSSRPRATYLDSHVVNFTQRFAYPGVYYTLSRQPWHLEQTEYWYRAAHHRLGPAAARHLRRR